MKKIIIFLLIGIICLAGCSTVKKPNHNVVLDTKFILFGIMKHAQSILHNGFLYYEIVVYNKNKTRLKNPEYVDSIKIVEPDGDTLENVTISQFKRNHRKFVHSGYMFSQGNYYYCGYNIRYNAENRPVAGTYKFKLKSITGHETVKTLNVKFKKDPIKGFPTKIRFDQRKRKITWKGTKGQTGYRVAIVKGRMGKYLNLANVVYFSSHSKDKLITKTEHTLPDYVKFRRGQQYHVIVVAHNSKDNSFEKQSYFHMQDKPSEIAYFVAR